MFLQYCDEEATPSCYYISVQIVVLHSYRDKSFASFYEGGGVDFPFGVSDVYVDDLALSAELIEGYRTADHLLVVMSSGLQRTQGLMQEMRGLGTDSGRGNLVFTEMSGAPVAERMKLSLIGALFDQYPYDLAGVYGFDALGGGLVRVDNVEFFGGVLWPQDEVFDARIGMSHMSLRVPVSAEFNANARVGEKPQGIRFVSPRPVAVVEMTAPSSPRLDEDAPQLVAV